MARLNVPDLVSNPRMISAICQLNSQGTMYEAAGRINGKTGEDIAPRPGEKDRFYVWGSIEIIEDLTAAKTLKKVINYEANASFVSFCISDNNSVTEPHDPSEYENTQRFSPLYVPGRYLCVVRWPTGVSVDPLKCCPDVHLITPSYKTALLDWISNWQKGSPNRAASDINAALIEAAKAHRYWYQL